MQMVPPTPTCAHFVSAEITCASCGGDMRLVLLEPHKKRLDLLTYHCTPCDQTEVFLMRVAN
jgi:hypothetical protein